MTKHLIVIALLALGLLAGCRTVMDRRISAHADTWRQLSARDQQRLRNGRVRDCDTEDMVRIALGPPDRVLQEIAKNGEARTVWVYEDLNYETSYSEFDTRQVNQLKIPSDERRITFHDGVVMNRARDATDIRQRIAAFRAKYNLPESFHLTDKAQIEEFRAILRIGPARYN